MKKCFYFPTWEEVKNVFISVDGDYLLRTHNRREFPTFVDFDFKDKSKDTDPIFQKYFLLLALQKKLGFDVYGEYVVLDSNQDISFYNMDSIIKEILSFKDLISSEEYDHSNYQQDLINIFLKYDNEVIVKLSWYPYSTINHAIKHFEKEQLKTYLEKEEYNISLLRKKVCGINSLKEHKISILNLLKELSKYHRGEENKFEEIRQILNI